jgi:membrane protease YdiL (CAAX protease family)
VGTAVVLAILVVQRVLFGQSLSTAVVWLGLTRTTTRGFVAGTAIGLLLLLVIPIYAVHAGMALKWYPGGIGLLVGLLAQGGVAEEVLFRGYLFGHACEKHRFWRAVALAMGPFVAVHLLLFLTLP